MVTFEDFSRIPTLHRLWSIYQGIGEVKQMLQTIIRKEVTMAGTMNDVTQALDRLEATVTKIDSTEDGAVLTINTMSQQLRDMAANAPDLATLQTRINAVADHLDQRAPALAEAIANAPTSQQPAAEPSSGGTAVVDPSSSGATVDPVSGALVDPSGDQSTEV